MSITSEAPDPDELQPELFLEAAKIDGVSSGRGVVYCSVKS